MEAEDVGVIGALASILSSVLLGSSSAPAEEETLEPATATAANIEIAELMRELAEMHKLLEKIASGVEAKS